MKTRDFCYWLQGFFEITDAVNESKGLTKQQVEKIKEKLDSCFVHEVKSNKMPLPQKPCGPDPNRRVRC